MLAITLLVRDEIDIISSWIGLHVTKCDLLVVTDNGSVDGTREVLESYAAASKKIILIDEPGRDFRQNEWVDRMIRIAIDSGATWIVNSDADEIWHCDFSELEDTPADIGGYQVPSRLFVPSRVDDPSIINPIARMKHWTPGPRTKEEWWCMRAWNKVVHRADGWRANVLGNHAVEMERGLRIVPAKSGWRIDHYPNRSWEQYRRKYVNGGEAYRRSVLGPHYGFHWRERYALYEKTGGIIALKRRWYEEIERDMTRLAHYDDMDIRQKKPELSIASDDTCGLTGILYVDEADSQWKRSMRATKTGIETSGLLDETKTRIAYGPSGTCERRLPNGFGFHLGTIEDALMAARHYAAQGIRVWFARIGASNRRGSPKWLSEWKSLPAGRHGGDEFWIADADSCPDAL